MLVVGFGRVCWESCGQPGEGGERGRRRRTIDWREGDQVEGRGTGKGLMKDIVDGGGRGSRKRLTRGRRGVRRLEWPREVGMEPIFFEFGFF